MRLRLHRRRLTIPNPSLHQRNAMPWPMRILLLALVLGVAAAVGIWAFYVAQSLTGVTITSKDEVERMRTELSQLHAAHDAQATAGMGANALLMAEKSTQDKLAERVQQLEIENRNLYDDLAFFEKLVPTNTKEKLAIRGVQGIMIAPTQLQWQVLVIQPAKNAPTVQAQLEVTADGLQNGAPWHASLPEGRLALEMKQYKRLTGIITVPAQTVVKEITVKLSNGSQLLGVQKLKL